MPDVVIRLLFVVAVLAVVTVAGRWWQGRQGRVRSAAGAFSRKTLAGLGLQATDAEAFGVLLTSPTCAPCASVKRVLGDLSGRRPGFRWVAVEAGDHLDLVRAHHVMRVPTLFVLDTKGRILARTSGVPAPADLERVLDRDDDMATVA